jgi:hypothetical protein
MLVGEMVSPEPEEVALRAVLTEFEPEGMQLIQDNVQDKKMKQILSAARSGFIKAIPYQKQAIPRP